MCLNLLSGALAGRVPVRVLGPVRSGDVLVPSGLDDGVANVLEPGESLPLPRATDDGHLLTSDPQCWYCGAHTPIR